MTDMSCLATRFKYLREQVLHLSQEQMAALLGLNRSALSQIERGANRPSHLLLKALQHIFGVRIEWLLTGQGQIFSPAQEILQKLLYTYTPQELVSAALSLDKTVSLPMAAETFARYNAQSSELQRMIAYLTALWRQSDAEHRSWIKIQFARAFPEYRQKQQQNTTKGH